VGVAVGSAVGAVGFDVVLCAELPLDLLDDPDLPDDVDTTGVLYVVVTVVPSSNESHPVLSLYAWPERPSPLKSTFEKSKYPTDSLHAKPESVPSEFVTPSRTSHPVLSLYAYQMSAPSSRVAFWKSNHPTDSLHA